MIIKRRFWWYLISGFLFVASLVSYLVYGLPLGIDFTGGNIAEIEYRQQLTAEEVRASFQAKGVETTVQAVGEKTFSVKFKEQPAPVSQPEEGSAPKTENSSLPQAKLIDTIVGEQGKVVKFDTVGPSVSQTLQRKALLSILYASIGIIIYLAWAFRSAAKIASAWMFGIIAVIALIHDTTIVIGWFSILGHFFSQTITVDTYFITAILTILGYSVNDTIVVFDRMREVARRHPELTVEEIAIKSVYNTLGRSLNTSLTVFLVLITMLLLSGGALFSFLLALSIGVFFGTYSSIFIAAPLLVTWHRYKLRRQR